MELLTKLLDIFLAFILAFSGGAPSQDADRVNASKDALASPLSVHYIDVGQADSVYISLPDGKTMLIDAGENEDGDTVVNYIKALGVSSIDYLVATHPHADHIGGIDDVINNFDIGTLYMPDAYSNTKTFESVLDAVENNNVKMVRAKNGVYICKESDLTIKILSPISTHYDETNDYSAVVRIVYGDTSFLFMGDAEKLVERQLISSSEQISSDVLKVGHHGSSTSSCEQFIKAVSPSLAVISVGESNSYGHPHDEVLRRLQGAHIPILRTDLQGTVVVGSDGKNIIY